MDRACLIESSRTFSASADDIFAAIANPSRLARWWGPKGFANTFEQFDFRVGGDWIFTMHGPDGRDYANHSVFTAIDPGRSVVLHHQSAPVFTMHMKMDADGNRTRLTWAMEFENSLVRDQLAPICVPANEENFDRLQRVLEESNGSE